MVVRTKLVSECFVAEPTCTTPDCSCKPAFTGATCQSGSDMAQPFSLLNATACRHCVIAFGRPSRVRCGCRCRSRCVVRGRAVSSRGRRAAARGRILVHRDIVGHKLKYMYVSAPAYRPEACSCYCDWLSSCFSGSGCERLQQLIAVRRSRHLSTADRILPVPVPGWLHWHQLRHR